MFRRALRILGASGVVCALGAWVGPGTAQAAKGPITANGTISCSGVTGKVTFSPPLTSEGTSPEVVTMAVHETHCTTSGNTNLPSRKITGSMTGMSDYGQNSCGAVNDLTGWSANWNWIEKGVNISPTTSKSGASTGTSAKGQLIFQMPKPHQLDGSWAYDVSVTYYLQADSSETESKFGSLCEGHGVSTMTLSGGVTTL
jgi:hypothetical protein